jgi:predicted dehydrogenase
MGRKVLKVGIGGYGRSGRNIHSAWLKQAPGKYKIVAVADELPERRKDAVDDFGCRVYKDHSELLKNEKELDLYINALPSFLHASGTIEALKAGNNVVCEKPTAANVRDFDRVVAAAEKAGKLYAPFQNSRFYPFFKKIREVLDSGVLGDILHIRSVWGGFGRRWDWQTLQEFGGGNLLNTGPHPMDHAIILFGDKQPKVFCRMKSIQPFGGDAEDFCSVTLYGDASDPVIEVLLSSYLAYPLGDMYNISGTLGGLAGGPDGLRWKYFDPEKAPKQKLWPKWSDNRGYCSEKLPWVTRSWKRPKTKLNDFNLNCKSFYNNIYDVLVNGGELVVKPEEVRRQVKAIEECHKQNPLPKRAVKKKK